MHFPNFVGLAPVLGLDDKNPACADDHMINIPLLFRNVVQHLGTMALELIENLSDFALTIAALS